MWTCVKCKQAVDDRLAVCPHCGASRSAGRFSREVQPQQLPQAQYALDFAHVRAGRGFMIFGTALAVLLPAVLLTAAALCRQSWVASLSRALYPDALASAPDGAKANALYWLIAVSAALLSSLPGLWTVGLGRILRRLGRMEELL